MLGCVHGARGSAGCSVFPGPSVCPWGRIGHIAEKGCGPGEEPLSARHETPSTSRCLCGKPRKFALRGVAQQDCVCMTLPALTCSCLCQWGTRVLAVGIPHPLAVWGTRGTVNDP